MVIVCNLDNCERKSRVKGWCEPHYRRWLRHGDPLAGRNFLDSTKVISLYESGLSVIQIAEEFEVTPTAIRKKLKENEIHLRKVSDAVTKWRIKQNQLKRWYNLSLDNYIEILYGFQKGFCPLCNLEAPSLDEMFNGRFWPVDHDHRCCSNKESCGECIRGILCQKCSGTLVSLWENPNWVEKVFIYINETRNPHWSLNED